MIAQVLVEGLILGILLMGVCAFGIRNGARDFWSGFWQMFVILSVMNLMDRFLVDDYSRNRRPQAIYQQ